MKNFIGFALAAILLIAAATSVSAQTWNSNAGGYNTGYGTVYGSFGLAMATQNMYNTMQMNIQRATMRQAMINKWGRAAVEKAEREAASRSRTTAASRNTAANSGPVVDSVPAPKNLGKFRPSTAVDTGKLIADSLGTSAEEKALLKQIFVGTKTAFESQAAAKGWKNDVAGALTFFIVGTTTIYHDSEEPSDEAMDVLYTAISRSIDEIPEFAKTTDREKQSIYDILIGFTGIPLALYSQGKESGDAGTVAAARQLSAKLIEIVLKGDAEKIRYANGSFAFAQ